MDKFRWMMLKLLAPEDESGAEQEQQQETNQEQQQQEEKPSRFDVGLAKMRSKEGEEQQQQQQQEQEPVKPGVRPEHIPEKFWDAKTGTIRADAAVKAYSDLETKMRNGGKIDPNDTVPEAPDVAQYFGDAIELDPEVDRLGLAMDDPGLQVAAKVFHEEGIGKATAMRIVQKMFKGMNEHAPSPVDPEQELKALGPNGKAAIDGTFAWLNKLDREGKLSDDDADMAVSLMGTARGVRFLNKLRGMTGEMSIPTGHHIPASGGMSPEEWQTAMMEAVGAKDYKRQEELDRMSAGVFGAGTSSGSPLRGIANR